MAGGGATVTLYFTQSYDTSSWIIKKRNTTTGAYADITASTGFTLGTDVVGGQTVTIASYQVTDGAASITDEDGLTNARIEDPAGPAVVIVPTPISSGGGG